MPFECEIAVRPPVAQLTASGTPDLAEWGFAMGALVGHPQLPLNAPLLCDLRHVRRLPRTPEGRTAVEELLHLVPARRVAFVVRAKTASRIVSKRFTRNRCAFEVFTDYHRALRWLVFGPEKPLSV